MREQLRRLGFGRAAYRFYFAPIGVVRRSIREGGPLEQWRTALGRREMERAARLLPALPAASGAAVELHLLTGERFWYQTTFCLWSFARQSARPIVPVIYDDGTLHGELRDALWRVFPAARFSSKRECSERMDQYLPSNRFPCLRERWVNYPHIRKLTDPHAGQTGWKLVIDSDLLFFHPPKLVLDWLDQPTQPFHATDIATNYGYSRSLIDHLVGTPVEERVNVGLTGLRSETLDWERLEFWCRALQEREGTNYFLEQALIAMLLANEQCVAAPADEYLTCPPEREALERRAVMHHYVEQSKRWYFQDNWRRVLADAASA